MKWVFGKKEVVVVVVKFFRQADDVLVGLGVVVVVVKSGREKRGLEQQPWEHTSVTSLRQGECILDDEQRLKMTMED